MSLKQKLLEVWRCASVTHCPGGKAGTCGENREVAIGCESDEVCSVLGCSMCASRDTKRYERNGECVACTGVWWMLPCLSLVGLTGLAVLAWAANRPAAKMHAPMAVASDIAGLACTAVQCISVFDKLDINWTDPISQFIENSSFASFDVEMFGGACYLKSSTVSAFSGQLSILPGIASLPAPGSA